MPRVAGSHDAAFGSDAANQKKSPSICELSDYEKLNSGQGGGGGGGKSESSGTGTDSSPSPDGATANSVLAKKKHNSVATGGATNSILVKKKNPVASGAGAGRHTKRLVNMKTAAAIAAVAAANNSGSVGTKKVAAAASSTSKKKANGGRRSIGSATKKKGSEVKKKQKKKPAVKKNRTKRQPAAKPAAAKVQAEPGRLVRIADYQGRMASPITSPIHRLNLTFTPEAMEGNTADGGGGKRKGKQATTAPSKRRVALVSGGTGRFNITQE